MEKELDNVLFRLSMVKDELFGGVVAKLLPRLLRQLTPQIWQNVPIRTKFVKILTHLHKRLSSLTDLQIPIAEVLELFTGQSSVSSTVGYEDDEEEDEDEDDEDDATSDTTKQGTVKNNATTSTR